MNHKQHKTTGGSFTFRQFAVKQDQCAMKVTTVACVQGAWLPDVEPKAILDIGAGTGILSLMAAQKYTCPIDAVEIDLDAFGQMKANVKASPWPTQISIYHADIRDFAQRQCKKYDLIISNPPFYSNQLKSDNARSNCARHGTSLDHRQLVEVCHNLISEHGRISMLLPPSESARITELFGAVGIHLSDQLHIIDTPGRAPKTMVSIFAATQAPVQIHQLVIKEPSGAYTPEFSTLLRDYYLYL
ncbi:MAG: methyltransferase [Cyclobacteriaceae bacterium]|nr:methyltransferase [Cyclobacteriaceae bacterium]